MKTSAKDVLVYRLAKSRTPVETIMVQTGVSRSDVERTVQDIDLDIAEALRAQNKKLLPMSLWDYYEMAQNL